MVSKPRVTDWRTVNSDVTFIVTFLYIGWICGVNFTFETRAVNLIVGNRAFDNDVRL